MDNRLYEILSSNLVNFRKQKGLTQVEVKQLTGLAQETISRIESNTVIKPPTIPTLEKLAVVYDKRVFEFFIDNADSSIISDIFNGYGIDSDYLDIKSCLQKKPILKKIIKELLQYIDSEDDQIMPILIDKLLKLTKEKRMAVLSVLT